MRGRSSHFINISNRNSAEYKTRELKNSTNFLKDLRYIKNEILTSCAYHEKNHSEQIQRLEKLNVPEDELVLINRIDDICYKLACKLKDDYNILIDNIEREFNFNVDTVLYVDNLQKEEQLDKEYWEKLRKIRQNDNKN
jgi:hypothetical protein